MLKYENKFKVGDTIKSLDFKPCSDRPDQFVIGVVMDADNKEHGFRSIKIRCMEDHPDEKYGTRVGDEVWVPMQVDELEYENRVTLVTDTDGETS